MQRYDWNSEDWRMDRYDDGLYVLHFDAQAEIARLREALHNTLACGLPEVVAAAVIEALQRKEGK